MLKLTLPHFFESKAPIKDKENLNLPTVEDDLNQIMKDGTTTILFIYSINYDLVRYNVYSLSIV